MRPLVREPIRQSLSRTLVGTGWFLHTSGHHALILRKDGFEDGMFSVPLPLEEASPFVSYTVRMWLDVPMNGHAENLRSLLRIVRAPTCKECQDERLSSCLTCHGSGTKKRHCEACGEHPHTCICPAHCNNGRLWCDCTKPRPLVLFGDFPCDAWLVHDLAAHMMLDPTEPFAGRIVGSRTSSSLEIREVERGAFLFSSRANGAASYCQAARSPTPTCLPLQGGPDTRPSAPLRNLSEWEAGAMADRDFQPDEPIKGSIYVVVRLEAKGGHGSLYRVRHHKLKRLISALKILHANLKDNREVALRMEQEAQILSAMHHPNIVRVTDAGSTIEVDENGRPYSRPYFVLEWLKGRSLASILHRVRGTGIGLHDSLEIAIEVADALDYAHTQHGVVHRDIKLDNVFLATHPEVKGRTITKLLDFGIASVLHAAADHKITQRPLFIGTPRSSAPEQLLGQQVSPQTDLYAFGLLLYEMLVGYGPFDNVGSLSEANVYVKMAQAHLHSEPAPLPDRDFPAAIVELVRACLQKLPENRPKSALDVGNTLREIKYRAESRRAQDLAMLSKTDQSEVFKNMMIADQEATDPGPPPSASELPPSPLSVRSMDVTATDSPIARQIVRSDVPRGLGGETAADENPYGGHATQPMDEDGPSVDSLIHDIPRDVDRGATTRTSQPMPIVLPSHGTAACTLPPTPPPIIDGTPVREVGDRFVLDRPDPPPAPVMPSYPTPPTNLHPPPPYWHVHSPPPPMTGVTPAAIAIDVRPPPVRSLGMLFRSTIFIPRHYTVAAAATTLVGAIVLTLAVAERRGGFLHRMLPAPVVGQTPPALPAPSISMLPPPAPPEPLAVPAPPPPPPPPPLIVPAEPSVAPPAPSTPPAPSAPPPTPIVVAAPSAVLEPPLPPTRVVPPATSKPANRPAPSAKAADHLGEFRTTF